MTMKNSVGMIGTFGNTLVSQKTTDLPARFKFEVSKSVHPGERGIVHQTWMCRSFKAIVVSIPGFLRS